MKNITFSADSHLVEATRARAREEHTTLNEQFRQWLADYPRHREQLRDYDEAIATLQGKLEVGRKLTREEMNER